MKKFLTFVLTFILSCVLATILVLMLPGHYHSDEVQLQMNSQQLNWTRSWNYPDQSLVSLIGTNLGYSIFLQSLSFLFVLMISFGLSLFALRWPRWIPHFKKLLAAGISAPSLFWIPLLVYFFSLKLEFLPLRYEPHLTGWILPLLGLAIRPLFLSTDILLTEWKRSETQNYFLVARSKGLSRIKVFFRHGLKNALVPYSTQMGNFLVQSLIGSVLVESLFSFPGIGLLFVQSLQSRDLPVVLSLTIVFTLLIMMIHVLIESTQYWIEPRSKKA